MGLDVTPHRLPTGPAPSTKADDPEVERVKAVLASRLLGEPRTPTHIGRFVVLERVGSGGMGVVYSAFDPQLDRKVAIKLLFEGGSDERERARLLGEAKAMAKLAHPNVVGVYEVGEHQGRVFVAMEYVRGRSLKRWVTERARSRHEVLAMCVQAGRGLAAAHAAGIVHRDFKPDNVLVGDDDRPRVLDFGLARWGAEERVDEGSRGLSASAHDISLTKLTRTGALVGTPAYMAPEQIRGEVVDAPADQFSFCVTVWELLVGERPFAGDTVETLFDHVSRGDRRAPRRGVMTGRLEAALRRGLAANASDRYPSMDALLAAIVGGASRGRFWATVAAGIVAFASLGGAGAWYVELERRRAECESEARAIEAVWNDDTKTQLHGALLATDVSYAQSTFEHAVPLVDEYVEAWRKDYANLCVATEVDRERSAQLWAASRSCLGERLDELEAWLDVLVTEADIESLPAVVPAAARLARFDLCGDDAWLIHNPPLRSDGEELADSRRQLTRAVGLDAAGKHVEALELAKAVANTAEPEGSRLRGAALLLAGTAAYHAGLLAESETLLGEAFDLSLETGDNARAAVAATELVVTVAHLGTDNEEGLWWGRIARGLLARSGSEDDLAGAQLDEVVAEALTNRNALQGLTYTTNPEAFADPERLWRHALAIRQRVQGPDHPGVGEAFAWLGRAAEARVWHESFAGRYDESIELYARALDIQERALGPEHPSLVATLNGLAGLELQAGSYDAAERHYERACSLPGWVSGHAHVYRAACLVGLGNVHQNRGSFDTAEKYFEDASAPGEPSSGKYHVPFAIHGLAMIHVARGSYETAQELEERALSIAERPDGATPVGVANLLVGLAHINAIRGAYPEAQRLFERALDIAIDAVGQDSLRLVPLLDLFGSLHGKRGAYDDARRLLERSLSIRSRALGSDSPCRAPTLVRLARVELDSGALERAHEHAETALELAIANGDRVLPDTVVDENGNESHLLGPGVVPSAQFVLAMVVWRSGDRAKAVELAETARMKLRDAGVGFQRELAEVEAWIGAHGATSKD